VTLYRIVQEQVRNIIAYSKATTAKITLSIIENDVQLVIQDNGIGFDLTKKNKGIGLLNIQERTLFYGGTIEINTAEGEGCRIRVKIPTF
jgi:signal transduction histidine kinase